MAKQASKVSALNKLDEAFKADSISLRSDYASLNEKTLKFNSKGSAHKFKCEEYYAKFEANRDEYSEYYIELKKTLTKDVVSADKFNAYKVKNDAYFVNVKEYNFSVIAYNAECNEYAINSKKFMGVSDEIPVLREKEAQTRADVRNEENKKIITAKVANDRKLREQTEKQSQENKQKIEGDKSKKNEGSNKLNEGEKSIADKIHQEKLLLDIQQERTKKLNEDLKGKTPGKHDKQISDIKKGIEGSIEIERIIAEKITKLKKEQSIDSASATTSETSKNTDKSNDAEKSDHTGSSSSGGIGENGRNFGENNGSASINLGDINNEYAPSKVAAKDDFESEIDSSDSKLNYQFIDADVSENVEESSASAPGLIGVQSGSDNFVL